MLRIETRTVPEIDQIQYEKDDKETVDSMAFIDHSKVDIKEQKAKNLDITYEFDLSPERFE